MYLPTSLIVNWSAGQLKSNAACLRSAASIQSLSTGLGPALASFGANIAGSVLGGLSESLSTIAGFRYLPLLAIAFYVLSLYAPAARKDV